MIDVLVTITIGGKPLTLFGSVDAKECSIFLNYQVINQESIELDLLHQAPADIPLLDTKAHQYTVYGCKFLHQSISLAPAGIVRLTGSFTRLVRETHPDKTYRSVRFRFSGMEQLFPYERFVTQFEDNENSLTFTKQNIEKLHHVLHGGIDCVIESEFSGVQSSDHLFELNVTQQKVIKLSFSEKRTIDDLLSIVKVVKQYFEFLLKQEIQLETVVFYDVGDFREGTLLSDPVLRPKTFVKSIKEKPYRATIEKMFKGLDGWLAGYDKYSGVIALWQKTIYNLNVSEDDLFIWRCQAFELLCTITEDIFVKANSLKGKNQANPNLRNFLNAVKALYGTLNVDSLYFKDIKEVRDKLTHNNPQKSVTDAQKKNAHELINWALVKTLAKIMDIEGIPLMYCLTPPDQAPN